jgi:hypothetical protein
MPKTAEIISEMLKENTGRHFLDSGDYYGRHWQRNQDRVFENEPAAWLEFSTYGDGKCSIEYTKNVYHFLVEHLEFDPDMQRKFDTFAESRPDDTWMELRDAFPAYLESRGVEIGGPYWASGPETINTGNHESLLSQVLLYVVFTADDEEYVLLQIHGGADIRGGYTAPKAFRVDSEQLISHNDGWIGVDTPSTYKDMPYWYTDDGYHWYDDQGGPNLEDYTCVKFEDIDDPRVHEINRALSDGKRQLQLMIEQEPEKADRWQKQYEQGHKDLLEERMLILTEISGVQPNTIFIDDDGNGYVAGMRLVA